MEIIPCYQRASSFHPFAEGVASRKGVIFVQDEKIANLMDIYLERKQRDRIRDQIINLALQYHLVSKFTSLVAIEKTSTRPLGHQLNTKAVALPLPHGWQHEQTFGSLPQTDTPTMLYLLIGLGLLIAGRLVRTCYQRD